MAIIFPFRAFRYEPAVVNPADAVTQPYDKITPAMQEAYYRRSPYNLVRVILGKQEPTDKDSVNVYTRAARDFRHWLESGVLKQDPQPSIYFYTQRFRAPGNGAEYERRGFIALGKLEDYGARVVHRHELTHSGPKADRLNLLRATRAHFGQIFMLYSDPDLRVEKLLARTSPADIDVKDEYGVTHRVWKVSEPAIVDGVRAGMADKKLIIADGHHRYETALAYRNERRAQERAVAASAQGGATVTTADAPFERVMMTFVNMDSPGLLILPTHRVLSGLRDFEGGAMIAAARSFFSVRDVGSAFDPQQPTALLPSSKPGETAMLAITRKQAFLLQADGRAQHAALAGLSAAQAQLDVVRLHKVVLESVLGISEQAVRELRNIDYLRDPAEAVARVRQGGADVAFLMNPVHMQQLRDIAFAGDVMPQKSTDFYPKLLSGLTIYALD